MTENFSCIKVPIMANGYFKKTKNSIYTKNTGRLDAVFHILFSLMADDHSARKSFEELSSVELRNFTINYFKHGTLQQTYLARTKLLQKVVNCQ